MRSVLLDQGLPFRTAAWLRDRGIDAVHARELGLSAAPDSEILEAAANQARVCCTLDHDFHQILAATGATAPSVVLLRVQRAGHVETGEIILRALGSFEQQLDAGAAVTVTRRAMRVRGLPLRQMTR